MPVVNSKRKIATIANRLQKRKKKYQRAPLMTQPLNVKCVDDRLMIGKI